MKKYFLLASLCLLLGAGCAPTAEQSIPEDATPGVNEDNCTRSGGLIDGDACACPDGYFDDPAGFCIDAQGKPGGSMRQ